MYIPHLFRTRDHGKGYILAGILLLICALHVFSQGWKTYQDEKDHFAFDYPANYRFHVELGRSGMYVFGGLRDAKGKWLLELDLEDSADYQGGLPGSQYEYHKDATFENFALYQAQLRCDADGPMGSTYCDRAVSRKPFVNRYGLQAVELYLNKVDERVGGPTTEKTIGPIYVIRLSDSARYKILVFFPDEDAPASLASASQNIADSVRVTSIFP